jgi:hypothetical protein
LTLHISLDGAAADIDLAGVLVDVARHLEANRITIPRNAAAYVLGVSWPAKRAALDASTLLRDLADHVDQQGRLRGIPPQLKGHTVMSDDAFCSALFRTALFLEITSDIVGRGVYPRHIARSRYIWMNK